MDTLNVSKLRYGITRCNTKFKVALREGNQAEMLSIREEADILWTKYIQEINRYKTFNRMKNLPKAQQESK